LVANRPYGLPPGSQVESKVSITALSALDRCPARGVASDRVAA
jgi:hypothetical protein